MQRTARTPDGRTLAIEEAGDPAGRPVLVHAGTPNSRQAARAKLEADREEMLAASLADEAKMLESLLTPTDAAALTGELAEFLHYAGHEGLAPGAEGWWEDSVAHAGPWGFELSAISVPVLLMHGRQDQFVPFGHGEWLAAHVPGVEARLFDEDGHLTLDENRVGEVHAWLAERL